MNKVSTAVYMLIAIVVILAVVLMSKPAVYGIDGKKTGHISILNFKKA